MRLFKFLENSLGRPLKARQVVGFEEKLSFQMRNNQLHLAFEDNAPFCRKLESHSSCGGSGSYSFPVLYEKLSQ